MLRTAGLLLTILLSLFAVNPAGAAEPTHSVPSDAKMEIRIHELVNKHRRSKGLPLLAFDHRLAAIARRHSEDMAAKRIPLGHDGFKARKAAVSEKIRFRAIAENVGMNNYPAAGTVRATVSAWLDSEGHRENIEGDYNLTGVGIAQDHRGTRYFTQLFVKRNSPGINKKPRFPGASGLPDAAAAFIDSLASTSYTETACLSGGVDLR